MTPAPFHEGKVPSKNAKVSDYEGGVKKMLLKAMHEYACFIFTIDAFPDDETQKLWSTLGIVWMGKDKIVVDTWNCMDMWR